MSAAGGLDLGPYLNAAGRAKLAATDKECTLQSIASSGFLNTAQLTVSGQKLSSLLELPELKSVIAAQKIGNGRAPQIPVLRSHSLLDDVIPCHQGRQLAKRWCAAGSSVYFISRPGPPTLAVTPPPSHRRSFSRSHPRAACERNCYRPA